MSLVEGEGVREVSIFFGADDFVYVVEILDEFAVSAFFVDIVLGVVDLIVGESDVGEAGVKGGGGEILETWCISHHSV